MEYLKTEFSGCPLILAQFFAYCRENGHGVAARIEELRRKSLKRKRQPFIELLNKTPHPVLVYTQSMVQVIQANLHAIRHSNAGERALALLSIFAHLDPKNTPLWLVLTLDVSKEDETRDALPLMERCSLMQWNRELKHISMHAVTQHVVSAQLEAEGCIGGHLRIGMHA